MLREMMLMRMSKSKWFKCVHRNKSMCNSCRADSRILSREEKCSSIQWRRAVSGMRSAHYEDEVEDGTSSRDRFRARLSSCWVNE